MNQIVFVVDGITYVNNFEPLKHYGTGSGTDHVTAFSFDKATFNKMKSKGMLFQGHGILVKKAVITNSPTSNIVNTSKGTNSHNNKIYNLSGQRVKNPQKGIYIRNGRIYIKR